MDKKEKQFIEGFKNYLSVEKNFSDHTLNAYCSDIENIKGDMGNSYEFKKSIGVHSFFDIPLHDDNGIIIGFVAVHWNNPIPPHVHLEEDYKDELFHMA